ncbi:sialic acid TRAP transporter substrate-binding protein SiaP [Treponema sp. HNW]|uniref:sialic acid TRAP transporter substrate-binding protein SiaP n=1 Tax=Treponema sp. HNW TaxID=3116654 RepID=UPI003D0D96DD
MKKIVSVLSVFVLACAVFAGGAKDAGKPVTLIYSTNCTPSDAHDKGALEFKRVLEQVSGGTMKVEYYNQGTLFKQDAEVAAVKSGDADIVYLSASWLAENSPWVSMFSAGYVFSGYEQMTKILNGEIGKSAFARIEKEQGVLPLAAYYLGTRQINLIADKAIKTPADLKGVNLRMPGSESWIKLGKAMGANPTPLAFSELYLALQSKTIDGQENPLPTVINAKFYEVTKSISVTNHLVDSVWPTINSAKWKSLTDQQKAWVMEAVLAGKKVCDEQNLNREKEAITFLEGKGLKVYYADLAAFQKTVLDAYLSDKAFTKEWDLQLLDQIRKAK